MTINLKLNILSLQPHSGIVVKIELFVIKRDCQEGISNFTYILSLTTSTLHLLI